jgi:hypothetical protein
MAAATKDTIYIDVDDEITSIIDKVRKSEHKIVALVLPKRAAMMQSSVNMKLLKRAADGQKKQLVLITSEAGLLPLAASVGLHVAKTLQSKPEVPDAAEEPAAEADEKLDVPDGAEAAAAEDKGEDFDRKAAAAKPIGELAGLAAADETIELDNTAVPKPDAGETKAKKAKSKISKSLKVPNFEKFRVRLIIGAAVLILLIVGWILANIVLPKATITVDTDTSLVSSSLTINLDAGAKTLNTTTLTVPANDKQVQKTQSEQVATTGQQNNGTKASGTVNMTAQECGLFTSPNDVPAGTGLTTSGLTFITQQDTSFTVKGNPKNGCENFVATSPTSVIAQNGGSNYNVGASTFTVSNRSDVSATSSASMTGGTDNIINIVAQADIDNAKQKISAADTASINTELENDLKTSGFYALGDTFNAGTPTITTSNNVGDQASNVTVTETTIYTMFGVKQSDLETLITDDVNKQIDPSKQVILNDGFSGASFNVLSQGTGTAQLTMQVTATAGPHLNTNDLKTQIAGKKEGEVKSIIGSNPGVTSVTVNFSPFWVDTTPKKAGKIVIQFVKTSQTNADKN